MRGAAISLELVILFLLSPNTLTFQAPTPGDKGRAVAYEIVMMGEMTDDPGTKSGFATVGESQVHLGFTTFKAPNGSHVTFESGEFTSPIEALRYLNHNIQTATKVLQEGDIVNKSREITGHRAEVIGTAAEGSAVLWTDGPWFYKVASNSITDCLKFEAQYRR